MCWGVSCSGAEINRQGQRGKYPITPPGTSPNFARRYALSFSSVWTLSPKPLGRPPTSDSESESAAVRDRRPPPRILRRGGTSLKRGLTITLRSAMREGEFGRMPRRTTHDASFGRDRVRFFEQPMPAASPTPSFRRRQPHSNPTGTPESPRLAWRQDVGRERCQSLLLLRCRTRCRTQDNWHWQSPRELVL